jgi:(3R)-3-hydroxyacyl-CoA dehydrogenase / 3a,7a,12a-trihydroxy-5b-cholest-24-enoyl-CoA hydratase / enoyl-CoA hydratase 2
MAMNTETLSFENRVAVVTGAGSGLGRAYARMLAAYGAKVVVNDLLQPDGKCYAHDVVAEIRANGGEAVACAESVEHGTQIIQAAMDSFQRIDIVINNAGNLRDRTFQKLTDDEWDQVYRVHLLGTYKVTHAAWPYLRRQGYGRVVCTTSGSGLYGSFGQANYAAAKMGTLGLVNSLAIEGKSKNVRVNAVAPAAGSRLTSTVWPAGIVDFLKPDLVAPLVVFLASERCTDTGGLFEAGGGWISRLRWQRTEGYAFPSSGDHSPEDVVAHWDAINDFSRSDNPYRIEDIYLPVSRHMPEDLRKQWLELAAKAEGALR